mgnify:CR=1 FL=1
MASKPSFNESEVLSTLNGNGYYQRSQIDRFNKFSRFGYFDPYNANTVTREYLFFTKPDLHLFTPNTQTLNPELTGNTFFTEAYRNHRDTMNQLQYSVRYATDYSPFCNLLSNTVTSKLDLPDISLEELETAQNIAGTHLKYPLATTTSSNDVDFSLEFEDTKFLDVYMFFRIWYEYELVKSDGGVSPPTKNYIYNKILHDQMSCYKIIVGEDMETILHYSKFWGVYPTSIPRSAFSDLSDGALKLPVNFKAQWVEDMDPSILADFNTITSTQVARYSYVPIYNSNTNTVNGKWCATPYIVSSTRNNRCVYKLRWKG